MSFRWVKSQPSCLCLQRESNHSPLKLQALCFLRMRRAGESGAGQEQETGCALHHHPASCPAEAQQEPAAPPPADSPWLMGRGDEVLHACPRLAKWPLRGAAPAQPRQPRTALPPRGQAKWRQARARPVARRSPRPPAPRPME